MRALIGNFWIRQLAAAAGYALAYVALLPFSDAHFPITAGLRLGCLLLVPYRYWPALFAGELLPLAWFNAQYVEQIGLVAVLIETFPPIALAMPVVWWCKSHLALFPAKHFVNVQTLLICGLLTSAVWGLANFVTMTAVVLPEGSPPLHLSMLVMIIFFVGKYISILAIVPLLLMGWMDYRAGTLRSGLRRFARSRLMLETVALVVPALVALSWISLSGNEDARQITRMVMFLPVAWLTLRHGWRATVLGGTLTIVCICLVVESRPEPQLLQVQALMALTVTCLFAMGARITAQNLHDERERLDARNAIRLAQQGLYLGELRIRKTALALEQVGGALQQAHSHLLNRFKYQLQTAESQNLHRQAASTNNQVYRLADSMHPVAWRDRGLQAAFQETIARALDEAGMAYVCTIKGGDLNRLTPNLHAALYRMACEMVAYVCEQETCLGIALSLRTGGTGSSRWAVLRLDGVLQQNAMPDSSYRKLEGKYLVSKLGASGLDLDSVKDHVRLYNGGLHVRKLPDRLRISCLLHDLGSVKWGRSAAPAFTQLWVH
jgi:glucose-6-phosphate-specific signal transduction histidine kinase